MWICALQCGYSIMSVLCVQSEYSIMSLHCSVDTHYVIAMCIVWIQHHVCALQCGYSIMSVLCVQSEYSIMSVLCVHCTALCPCIAVWIQHYVCSLQCGYNIISVLCVQSEYSIMLLLCVQHYVPALQCGYNITSVLCSVDIDSLDAAVAQDSSAFDVNHISDDLLIEESGKLLFLIGLMDNLRDENHRCLVFSSSRRMLDIVQKVMQNRVRHVLFT